MNKRMNTMNISGFTLVEFMVALIIMGGVAGWAYPRYLATMELLKMEEAKQNLIMILAADKRYFLRNGAYASADSDLDITVRPLEYFDQLQLGPGTPVIASYTRKQTSEIYKGYVIRINPNGDFICTNSSHNICEKANLPSTFP